MAFAPTPDPNARCSRWRRVACALCASCLALVQGQTSGAASTSAWPTRPVKILVGFPGGTTPDMAARALAEPLARALGQPVLVENRPGASGNMAANTVAKASDDHTLGVVINGNLTSARMLNPKLPYDPAKDFTPLSLLTTAPLVLVAQTSQPSGSAFFAAAQRSGSSWNYGSVGIGSVGHLGMELLKSRVPGLQAVHVPYLGNPQIVNAMLGQGEIQMALVPPGVAMPHVRAGKLQAIGLTSGRSTLVPEVPPLSDAGIDHFQLEVWTALVGPSNLSPAARQRLALEVPKIMHEPATRQRLFLQGWSAVGTSPEGLRNRIREESTLMHGIITTHGIHTD